ncbi:heterokaryon incompatibility protein-domain-containing protein [Podospora australis]|uniref:Heterokaryon incompatibility protein-domain-containing protein n=1 Tax=Podospora australis TaxID=1536484 RepID=A0AAN7AFQ9_9PEZI|nr:heterokaryon incompatibility protein-domain-containing protein [Podospora australis]
MATTQNDPASVVLSTDHETGTHYDHYSHAQTRSILADLGQHLITISKKNRHHLLLSASERTHSDEKRVQATTILTRLHDLNPDVAAHFHPKGNVLEDLALRMICTHGQHDPSLPHKNENDVPSFIAVSYCWHYHTWPLAPHATPIVPGWEISVPMMQAVLDLRTLSNEGIWLDKLCINQKDTDDKTLHIASMDTIYRSARRLVILLEDVQLTNDEERAGLAYAGFYRDLSLAVKDMEGQEKAEFMRGYFPSREKSYGDNNPGRNLDAAKGFAVKMLSARWFTRAWCAHESRMHPHRRVDNPLFLCFNHSGCILSFEFRFLHYLGMHLADREPPENMSGDEMAKAINDPDPKSVRQLWWRILKLMPNEDPSASAMQHLVSILSMGCFFKGDLMSISLNTAGIPLFFDGKEAYTLEDVIWMFSLLVLAAGDLVPLITSGSVLRLNSPEHGKIISWAINPTQGVLDERLENPLSESITAITREYIELDLLVFARQPQKASASTLEIAEAILEKHDLRNLADTLLGLFPDSVQRTFNLLAGEAERSRRTTGILKTPFDTFLSVTLAAALEAGLDWMLAFPGNMVQSTQEYLHGVLGGLLCPDPRIAAAGTSVFAHFAVDAPAEDQAAVMGRFFSLLLDPRLRFFTMSPRRLPLPSLMGSCGFIPAVPDRAYLAVPLALVHLPDWQERAWVVEPFDASAGLQENHDDCLPDIKYAAGKTGILPAEDFSPVLTTDYCDRRAPVDDKTKEWRWRRRERLFGCGMWDVQAILKEVEAGTEQDKSFVLKRQRVYGAEDYHWGDIFRALKALEVAPEDLEKEKAQDNEAVEQSVREKLQDMKLEGEVSGDKEQEVGGGTIVGEDG